jgi:hypothetical protein
MAAAASELITGNLGTGTHLSGNGVNQDLPLLMVAM